MWEQPNQALREQFAEAVRIRMAAYSSTIVKTTDNSYRNSGQLNNPVINIETRRRLNKATNGLWETKPTYSAKTTFTRTQKSTGFLIGIASVICAILTPDLWFIGILAIFSTIYLGCVLLRGLIIACFSGCTEPPTPAEFAAIDENDLPDYSVLVALYKEANQVRRLTKSLDSLIWPKSKLDIKLVCEAIDHETISAIQALKLPSHFELVIVPDVMPRTKPKALNYALSACRGEYLVLYDAEDSPNPFQLLEAHQNFKRHDPSVACLQAPLLIHNHNQSWLTGLFALEYCTLFRGILPVLARWKMPLPLGGTSNHFKTAILKTVGGWDPYNVTEDADLGLRLGREGFRSHVISLPTWEEAPPDLKNWIPQRTRWLKGWMQTILVHSRNPTTLISDIGLPAFLTFHFLMTSIVLSSLLHPIFLTLFLIQLMDPWSLLHSTGDMVLLVSVFIMVGGYSTYGAMAYMLVEASRMNKLKIWIPVIPIYWLLIALAGWRAAIQLVTHPHYWEKTKHGLANSSSDITLMDKRDCSTENMVSQIPFVEEPDEVKNNSPNDTVCGVDSSNVDSSDTRYGLRGMPECCSSWG